MSQKVKDRLKDILIETEYLTELQQELRSQEDLEENKHIRRAAERSIKIIGEAVKNLPHQ